MPTPPKSTGPSLRVTLNPRSSTPPPPSKSSSPPQAKKRRFTPPESVQPNTAQASDVNLLHQKTSLSFVLHHSSSTSEPSWHARGVTSLYVLVDSSSPAPTSDNNNIPVSLGFCLRGTCQVVSVQVEAADKDLSSLVKLSCDHQHFDPLERVLLKPPISFTMDDVVSKTKRHEADSHWTRGATGMTNAVRAASIASNMGELRISTVYQQVPVKEPQMKALQQCWKRDISLPLSEGEAQAEVKEKLEKRADQRKASRIDLVAKSMAAPNEKQRALKVTVRYNILLGVDSHFGGIHAITGYQTPHIYTTSGVYGDHEGPRSWIPTLDSASTKHRASHDMTIQVTALMSEGLSVVGFGEDYGATETYLHDLHATYTDGTLSKVVGKDLVEILDRIAKAQASGLMESPHIIPPEPNQPTSMDNILATSIWSSCSWLPISSRSLGFAIGPFRVLEDPEYFSVPEDDGSEEADEAKAALESTRANGEGIRQAYFAPIFSRKFIHAQGNTTLIPNTQFLIAPLTQRQLELSEGIDQSLLTGTTGVPHRALSLMRDILALPSFRTVSYTQIWIPGAVHGGATSGSLHNCPEAMVNPFLGGSIMDSRLLPPVGHRLPHHLGGRVLQFLQARCAVRGWITSAVPLGGRDDVGQGYIHTLIESLLMSLYERGHGAHGEGGPKGSAFFTKRYASGSGLNSSNLDFLPVQNIEDTDFDVVVGSVIGAVPVEDRNNEQLWRSASNGSESHTSSMDEFAVRQLLTMDCVNTLERGTEYDKAVPKPSEVSASKCDLSWIRTEQLNCFLQGWLGSHLALSFLSSNATSSTHLGCGALELMHPVGGLPYRALKGDLFRRVVEGRAGIANLVRLVRATFVAAHLGDLGKNELKYPPGKITKGVEKDKGKPAGQDESDRPKPRFIVCVNELLKKNGLTHILFTRTLQNLAGRVREAHLSGYLNLVDIERNSIDPRTNRPLVLPEGFPNSFVRGASEMCLRVGVHVEPARDTTGVSKGIQLLSYAEPAIPEGGISYGGPVTVRVVENEGQLREFVKDINPNGSRRDWGSLFLHAKPVTLPKAQTAASGIIESASSNMKESSKASKSGSSQKTLMESAASSRGAFSESNIHRNGYQAIELIRLTNLTPLLWVRVDPMGLYGGRISVYQPDACLAELLFHDGCAGAQVEALRALAERPLRIQGSVKVTSVYDVKVSELPVRLLGDCLRGTPALHSSLPHTPVVRAQAALAIAQWQNNKAPATKNAIGANHWVGLHLLIQYFRERFYNNGTVMRAKLNRVVLKKNDEDGSKASNPEGTSSNTKAGTYHYLDSFEEGEDRAAALGEVDEVEVEEDEEYRVRSSVITAVASIRSKDGMTPAYAIEFLETILVDTIDSDMMGNLVSPDEQVVLGKKRRKADDEESAEDDLNDGVVPSMPYVSSMLVADALLALCHINVCPALITDPTTGKPVQSSARHPVSRLMESTLRWLEWELLREGERFDVEAGSLTGVSGNCFESIGACAITALSSLAILRQSTTDPQESSKTVEDESEAALCAKLDEAATAPFYMSIFDSKSRSDATRAACTQAILCICCAADRFESKSKKPPVGLLNGLEFVFERLIDQETSPGLRHTLALLMLDACTGKICSMQRVGAFAGKNDLVASAARFLNGPLGTSHGGDSGSAAVTSVDSRSYPAAHAVNVGAKRGLQMISKAGHPKFDKLKDDLIARVARFATNLWRTINGEPVELAESIPGQFTRTVGVCANDGHLRCALLALWQWVWPKGCFAVDQVRLWSEHTGTQHYKDIGADRVMKISIEEEQAAAAEENSPELMEMKRLVETELDRQWWRGEMARMAYDEFRAIGSDGVADASAAEQGIGRPLPPIKRDAAFKAGGWIASTAQQRRQEGLDGGTAITKIRIRSSAD